MLFFCCKMEEIREKENMLKKFKVKNFKNFKEEILLDLSKVNNYEFSDAAIRNKMIKTALVYGENASGKSNLGYALFDINLHLTDKQKNLEFYRLYGNLECNDATDFFYEFEFEEGSLKYEYRKKSAQELLEEKIWINDTLMLQYDFLTHEGEVLLEGAETLNINLTEKNISFVKYVSSNTILKENTENNIFHKFMWFVENMLWFSSLEKNDYQGYYIGSEKIGQGIIKRNRVKEFQEFLSALGIEYKLIAKEIEGEQMLFCRFGNREVNFYSVASRGTCSLALFYYWLLQLEKVSFVFIDEFDAFYHNNLAEAVVKELLKLPRTQSLLTTHNTDIMTNDLLRPDCYLRIQNGRIKSFSESTQKELRKAHNLQKMYNAGAFDD